MNIITQRKTMSSYLIQRIDDYVINSCFNNERNWKRVKPWWFGSKVTEAIAWSVMNYSKQHGYPPSKSLIPSLIDYKKSNITIEEVELVLRGNPIDSKLMLDLLLTFESNGMLWDIVVKHHKNKINDQDFKELRSIADKLKDSHMVDVMDYQTIIKQYRKWIGNY